MSNTLTGTVKQILDEQSGSGRNGTWRKREFILETEGKFPKPVCIVQWGDDIDSADLRVGERVTAHIDLQSREYNGRWYTDVKAWRIERPDAAGSAPPRAARDEEPWPTAPADEADDDLPF